MATRVLLQGARGLVLACVLLSGDGLAGPPAIQDDATSGEAAEDDPLASARQALLEGGADEAVLAVRAMELVQAGDVLGLRRVLEDAPRESVLGVLHALEVRRVDGLLDVLVDLAGAPDAQVADGAARHVRSRARSSEDVVAALIQRLATPGLPATLRRTLVELLGQSRDLAAVEPLLAELDGPAGRQAHEGLTVLTGHRPPERSERVRWWRDFWDTHRTDRRDVLLERALEVEIERGQGMVEEVIQTRLTRMGNEVDALVTALADDYKRVRLEAVRRLVENPNREQAATAVPVMLRRLDHLPADAGGNGGDPGTNGAAAGAPEGEIEPDAEVRAALVAALGALGGGRADVQAVLLDVLRSDDLLSARAAVAALERLRDEPTVVAPLLQFLGRSNVDELTLVTVLEIVARNKPVDVFAELSHWLGDGYGSEVRAAALEAVLADAELSRALPAVVDMADPDQPLDVRYALARSLGARARGLARDDAARGPMLALLSRLVGDADPSVRAEAAASLGNSGDAGALPVLEQLARVETNEGVVQRLIGAFGSLGSPDSIETIGRLWSAWSKDSSAAVIEEACRRALEGLAPAGDAAAQLAMVVRLRESGAPRLAAWAAQRVVQRLDAAASQEDRDLFARARGEWAEALALDGRHQEARELLVELHESDAPYPGRTRRLELLSSSAAALQLHDAAADEALQLLELLSVGDIQRGVVLRRAVTALRAAGRLDEALTQLDELVAETGASLDLSVERARLLVDTGQPDEALATLVAALAGLPDDDTSPSAVAARALLAELEAQAAEDDAEPTEAAPPAGGDGTDAGSDETTEGETPDDEGGAPDEDNGP